MTAWTCDVSIEEKVRQDCYNRGYEEGRKNPCDEIVAHMNELQKEVDRLTKELANVPDPFPCKVGSGCEAAGQCCYDCPNNRYRERAVKDTAKVCYEIFKFYRKNYYDIPMDLVAEEINEKTGVEVE